jgi:8-oxo-dGTP diphosphatase
MGSDPAERIVVVAAVIERDNRFLVSRRLAGTHLAGFWEFPGGKVDAEETREAALEREIAEELGCQIVGMREVFHTSHSYPDRVVELHFYRGELVGSPQPMLGQEIRWIDRAELATLEFPPADNQLIAALVHDGG